MLPRFGIAWKTRLWRLAPPQPGLKSLKISFALTY